MSDGVRATIEIDTSPVADVLARLARAGAELEQPLDAIGAVLVANTVHRFETGQAPGGAPWLQSLRAKIRGGQTLVDTARLKQSFSSLVIGKLVVWGTNVLYAAIHQFGGTILPRKGPFLIFTNAQGIKVFARKVVMPARPFVGFDKDDETDVREILVEHLQRIGGASAPQGGAA
jgi:phage virion morphogenesis protein